MWLKVRKDVKKKLGFLLCINDMLEFVVKKYGNFKNFPSKYGDFVPLFPK
jgi:hypothetical protein